MSGYFDGRNGRWNCCRFTWQVFEESPESYLSPSRGVVWGYLDGRFDYGASGVCTRYMRRYGSVWLVCSVRLLDEPTAGRKTPVCHDCLVVNGTSKLIINISSRHGC